MLDIPPSLDTIVKSISQADGIAMLVGGAVIDSLQGRPIKDWDIEVYKLSYQDLLGLLSVYGTPNLVGQEFGIVKLKIDDIEYDFNVPRRESKIGLKHTDFEIELVPDIPPEEAALRRDLTINSMYLDLHSGELHDPYHGKDDLEKGILRHTSDKFSEDPLRVLRIMQLLPRKGKVVAPETIKLCRSMVDTHQYLPRERIFEEWNKLLLKTDHPSIGLNFLKDSGWLVHYPELSALEEIEQHPVWHPEGNVWNHTLMVLDNAAQLRPQVDPDWQLAYMYGSLLHDVGKAKTTLSDFTAHGHDKAGVPLAKEFLDRLTNNTQLTEYVLAIVEHHMQVGHLYRQNARESGWKRLHNKLRLDIAAYVSLADNGGRPSISIEQFHPVSAMAMDFFRQYGIEKIAPLIQGRDLLALGYKPGPEMGKVLRHVYELQIEGNFTNQKELMQVAGITQKDSSHS